MEEEKESAKLRDRVGVVEEKVKNFGSKIKGGFGRNVKKVKEGISRKKEKE